MADGDPNRRATDHGESFGASIKDSLHRRCLRRRLETQSRIHKRRKAKDGGKAEWTQGPLRVSRVMQVFRDVSVKTRMLWEHDESKAYMQRKHYLVRKTGFATVGRCGECEVEAKPAPESIFVKIQEGLEHA